MNKVEPTYVTFEQAKWLKEKGFDESHCKYWNCSYFTTPEPPVISMFKNEHINSVKAPEQHQVVEWLRVNHAIWILVNIAIDNKWYFELYNLKDKRNSEIIIENEDITDFHETPQEAYSAAFDYIKEKELI
jgi:hypothetical protein